MVLSNPGPSRTACPGSPPRPDPQALGRPCLGGGHPVGGSQGFQGVQRGQSGREFSSAPAGARTGQPLWTSLSHLYMASAVLTSQAD